MSNGDFIVAIAPAAKANMKQTGILASLTMAQAILESNWGTSGLATKGKNLFGIKGKGTAGSITMSTKEWDGTKYITIDAAFAKYNTWGESIDDHASLFTRLSRYHNLINETDYRRAAVLVQKDGYATDPDYSNKLIKLIETYGLAEYDKEATVEKGLPEWGAAARESLTKIGITDGSRPNDNTTRLETWAFLDRAVKLMDTKLLDLREAVPKLANPSEFSKVPPEWAKEAITNLTTFGVTDGSEPNRPATRAEVWVMLSRILDHVYSDYGTLHDDIESVAYRLTEIENQLEQKGVIGKLTDLILKPFKRGASK